MSRGDQQTRYGFPPERDPYEAFPATIPWDTPISEMGWHLVRVCCNTRSVYPLRLMAAQQGWHLTLRDIVPRIRCSTCGQQPAALRLHKNGTGEHGMMGAHDPWLDLLGG